MQNQNLQQTENFLGANFPWMTTGRGGFGMFLAIMVGLVGCGSPATSSPDRSSQPAIATISIESVHKTAPKASLVALKGIVGDRAPLLGATVYELQDNTGKIWILTQKTAPEKGQEVVVTGTLRFRSIPINGQEQGSAYVEQE
jgi:hypothetical protein